MLDKNLKDEGAKNDMKKKAEIYLVYATLIMLFSMFAFANRNLNRVAKYENRMLSEPPTVSIGTEDYPEQFNSWINDNVLFRDELGELSSFILFKIFGIMPSERVHKGSDGWYFYTGDDNLGIADETYSLTDGQLNNILQYNLAIRDWFKSKGIDYVLVLPCSKVSIYPEYYNGKDWRSLYTPVDKVADYIEQNSDIKVIRLKQTLGKEKEKFQVYYKNDSHWTKLGAYAAYRHIIECLKEYGLCDGYMPEVSYKEESFTGEFGYMMGYPRMLGTEQLDVIVIDTPTAEKDDSSKTYLDICNILNNSTTHYNAVYHFTNNNRKEGKVIWFGDSLFEKWNLPELFSESFKEYTYVWGNDIDESLVDYLSPNVVVYEIGERFLNQLENHNTTFVNWDACITGIDVEGNDLYVKAFNSTSINWSAGGNIRMCIWDNNSDIGMRANIEDDASVAPNSEYTFCFKNIPREYVNNPQIEVQMLKEGVCYFGQRVQLSEFSKDVSQKINAIFENSQTRMISEEDYGEWIGKYGVCLDSINNRILDNNGSVLVDDTALNSTIVGWAANFDSDNPFDELYCRIGNDTYLCEYGIDRQSVVDHYNKESLRYTGFQVTVPTESLFTEDGIIEFIGIAGDAIYEPVSYKCEPVNR